MRRERLLSRRLSVVSVRQPSFDCRSYYRRNRCRQGGTWHLKVVLPLIHAKSDWLPLQQKIYLFILDLTIWSLFLRKSGQKSKLLVIPTIYREMQRNSINSVNLLKKSRENNELCPKDQIWLDSACQSAFAIAISVTQRVSQQIQISAKYKL